MESTPPRPRLPRTLPQPGPARSFSLSAPVHEGARAPVQVPRILRPRRVCVCVWGGVSGVAVARRGQRLCTDSKGLLLALITNNPLVNCPPHQPPPTPISPPEGGVSRRREASPGYLPSPHQLSPALQMTYPTPLCELSFPTHELSLPHQLLPFPFPLPPSPLIDYRPLLPRLTGAGTGHRRPRLRVWGP